MTTYHTSEVARQTGIHPNTVRTYEALGFISPVPRGTNGYRQFSPVHIEQVKLVLAAMKSTWLGGAIRKVALRILRLIAIGQLAEAASLCSTHHETIKEERKKAELAVRFLQEWAAGLAMNDLPPTPLTAKQVTDYLQVTPDMLRSWERNDLIVVPRHPFNGYRQYGECELRRLYLIRALRKARFSLSSIHRMLTRFDGGERERLSEILDSLPPEEEDIFFTTDKWLSKIHEIEKAALEMVEIIGRLQKNNE